jgi:hypothetical protein
MWQFITDHDKDVITLTLRKEDELAIWRVHMDRSKAGNLADAVLNGNDMPLWIEGYHICVVGAEMGGCIMLVDNGVYMAHKIRLSRGQRQDLSSTLQMHIRASELDTRPKDVLPPLDDRLPGQWTPEKEKDKYGGFDGPDEKDPADWWRQ